MLCYSLGCKKPVNNIIKGLPLGSLQCSLDIWLFFCTERKRRRQIFKGVVLKASNLLSVKIVILFKQWLEHYRFYQVLVCVLSHFSRVQLCSPMDYSPPSSSVHGILQARILEWVALPSSSGSSLPGDWTCVSCISCITGRFFTHWATWGAHTTRN